MKEAEIEDLEECSEMFDFTGFQPEEDKRLIAEVKRLRAALGKFGRHPVSGPEVCALYRTAGLDAVCDCGFDEALNA